MSKSIRHLFSNPAATLAALLTPPDAAAEQATRIAAIINSVNAGSHVVEVGSGQEPSANIITKIGRASCRERV